MNCAACNHLYTLGKCKGCRFNRWPTLAAKVLQSPLTAKGNGDLGPMIILQVEMMPTQRTDLS